MKILILGAGAAGLTLGNRLIDKGLESFLILEHEQEPGGLCRSIEFEGEPIDIRWPHYLDHNSDVVVELAMDFVDKLVALL